MDASRLYRRRVAWVRTVEQFIHRPINISIALRQNVPAIRLAVSAELRQIARRVLGRHLSRSRRPRRRSRVRVRSVRLFPSADPTPGVWMCERCRELNVEKLCACVRRVRRCGARSRRVTFGASPCASTVAGRRDDDDDGVRFARENRVDETCVRTFE